MPMTNYRLIDKKNKKEETVDSINLYLKVQTILNTIIEENPEVYNYFEEIVYQNEEDFIKHFVFDFETKEYVFSHYELYGTKDYCITELLELNALISYFNQAFNQSDNPLYEIKEEKSRYEFLKELSREELIKLHVAYDQYIIEFLEDEDRVGQTPVCLREFYDYEFQEFE